MTANRRRPPMATPITLAIACLGAQTAFAQTPALPEVQVTAPSIIPYLETEAASNKFTAPLLDTPKSVHIINHEMLEERGVTSLVEALRTTPGISFGSGEGGTPMGDRPFIRGYEASTDIMIDGVRDLGRITHETFNLDSVEIIKGPGSAYSGRGSTGGSINLISKKPLDTNSFAGTLGLGNASHRRATLDGNWRLNAGTALRLNAMAQNAGVPGRDVQRTSRWGLAPSISFGMDGPTRVTLSYYALRAENVPDLGIPFDLSTGLPAQVRRNAFYGIHARDFRQNDVDLGTVEVEHRLANGWQLHNLLRYGKSLNRYIMTRPTLNNAGQLQINARAADNLSHTLANHLSLSGQGQWAAIRHDFSLGLELSRDQIKSSDAPSLGGAITGDIHSWDPGRAYGGPTRADFLGNYENLRNRTNNQSLYAFNTAHLSPQWQLNTGLRLDNYRVTNGVVSQHSRFWNYQLGLVYKPAANGSLYAAYGTSSNPSGETEGQSGGADGIAGGGLANDRHLLDPERNRSFELGTKWELLEQRLQLNAALFHTVKVNQRATDPNTNTAALIGDNRTRGLELSATGALIPKWAIYAGYTHLDPKIKNAGTAVAQTGNVMKYVARNSLNLWTSYKLTPELTLAGGSSYVSRRNAIDTAIAELPAYWRHDLMASYQVNRQWQLQLNLLNLTNERIYEASHMGLFANLAPGRAAVLSAKFLY